MENAVERIGELLSRLQSADFYEREDAVRELGTYNTDEAVAGLVLAIEDPDLGIRELAADRLVEMAGPTTSRLLIKFLAHADIGVRNLASEILVRIGADAVPAAVEEIGTDDSDVRKFIVDVLGLIAHPSAVEPLCQCLWDECANVACSAAEALGEIRAVEAVPHLIAAYEKIDDVRLQAVEALGKIGDTAALDKLYTLLQESDPTLVFATVEAIGNIGKPESVAYLSPVLNGNDTLLAESALTAVIRISARSRGRVDTDLPLDRFAAFLFDGVRHGNPEITAFMLNRLPHWFGNTILTGLLDVLDCLADNDFKRVADILSGVGPGAAQAIVKKLAEPHLARDLRMKLFDLLRQFVDEDIARQILPHATDADPEIRQKVAHVLGISGYRGAVPVLKELAVDSNGHVRSAALGALGWLGNQEDVDFIVKGLDDSYPDVREAAVGALVIIGGPVVIKKFTADLFHEDAERQRLAVTALGWIGEDSVIQPLLCAINHESPDIRKSAIASLSRMGAVEDVHPILVALNDENSSVRKAAVTALVSLRGTEAMNDIRFLLDDEDMWVRYHTICAIGELGQEEHARYIMPYLNDDLDIIKIAAVKALAGMGIRDAVPDLDRLTREKNQDVVDAAQQALSSIGDK